VLTINTVKKNYKKILLYYSLFLIPIIFIFIFPVNDEVINKMIYALKSRDLYFDAIRIAASSKGNIDILNYEFKTNLLNIYNLRVNLFFIFMATVPFYLILIFLNNNNYFIKNNLNIKYLLISHAPFLALFVIGDTGRWINLIAFISLGYLAQFSFKRNIKNYNLKKIKFNNFFIYFFLSTLIFIYSFFIRMPHCCDLEKKNINIWGGLSSKIIAYVKILKKDDDKDYNLDLRFKK
jgi:hypothetical protein